MLKNRFSIHFNKGWRRFVYDSHVSLGIYAVIFLLLMDLTGPTMSFGWYNKGASAIVGMKSDSHDMHSKEFAFGFDKQHQQPMGNIQKGPDSHTFMPNQPNYHGPMGSHMLFMKIHGGQWASSIGEIIYFFAALIGGFLPISGYYCGGSGEKKRNAMANRSTLKIKLFRANLRGVADTKFFLIRLANVFAFPH